MQGQVRSWMTTSLQNASVEDPVFHAVEVMAEMGVRHVVVLNAAGELAGILSNRDIIRSAMRDPEKRLNLHGCSLDKIMTAVPLHTIRPDALLSAAAGLMHREKVSALPVVESGRLLGLITSDDVLRAVLNKELPSLACA